jgi:hypothetical protein
MKQLSVNAAVAALSLFGAAALAQTDAKPATEAKPAAKAARAVPAGAVIQAVQMPAWVERDGNRIPAAPGMPLKERDQLRTGANSRLWFRTPDGSLVKMGENGSLAIGAMQMKDRVFQAALSVAEGAFRFTTEAVAKFRGKRSIDITVATVTAGIRGTDLWGKSSPGRQVVCLIEGRIEVTPPGEAAIAMEQPLSFYVRDKNSSQPVAPVPPEQLKQWAAETETQAGQGVARRGGKWKITAVSSESAADALRVYEDIRSAGYAAELQPAKIDDKRIYTVQLSNFASKADAEKAASDLKRQDGLGRYDYKVGM